MMFKLRVTEMNVTAITDEKADSLQEEFFGTDVREHAVLMSLQQLLPSHSHFIDVGANIGQYSSFANRLLWNSEIICIEANTALLDLLKSNLLRAAGTDPHNNSFKILNNIVSESVSKLTRAEPIVAQAA
jgi:hypothetical protein